MDSEQMKDQAGGTAGNVTQRPRGPEGSHPTDWMEYIPVHLALSCAEITAELSVLLEVSQCTLDVTPPGHNQQPANVVREKVNQLLLHGTHVRAYTEEMVMRWRQNQQQGGLVQRADAGFLRDIAQDNGR